jgi:hypothetical protein
LNNHNKRLGLNWRREFVGISFREFVNAVSLRLDNGRSVDHHFSPQVESDDELALLQSLGESADRVDIHNFHELLPKITYSVVLKNRIHIPHLNRTNSSEGWIQDHCPGNEEVSSLEFARERKLPAVDSLFSDRLQQQFVFTFGRDFDLFGYDPNCW